MTNDAHIATASQTVGPFFHHGLPPIAPRTADAGRPLTLRVTDGNGDPVDDALIELWTADFFARVATGKDGTCTCDIGPARYVNVCFFARGLLRQLHTRIYFADDPALASDQVFALVPEHRRPTLVASPDPRAPGGSTFHLRLQGPHETVFFDI